MTFLTHMDFEVVREAREQAEMRLCINAPADVRKQMAARVGAFRAARNKPPALLPRLLFLSRLHAGNPAFVRLVSCLVTGGASFGFGAPPLLK